MQLARAFIRVDIGQYPYPKFAYTKQLKKEIKDFQSAAYIITT